MLLKTLKIRLYPSIEQEALMWKHIGAMRFIYNWALAKNIENFKQFNKRLSVNDLGKELTKLKRLEEYSWLYEISNATLKESLRDLEKAYKRFFQIQKESEKFSKAKIKKSQRLGKNLDVYDLKGHPKFKSRKKSEPKFYSRHDRTKFLDDTVHLEMLGNIKYKSDYNIDLTAISKFSNPRVMHNGRVWVLNIGIEVEDEKCKLNDFILGIDLGIKKLAVTNIDSLEAKNINRTKEVRSLEKKLLKLQRQCSRKYLMNRSGDKFKNTNNIIKLEQKIKKLHNRLKHIRENYIHQITSKMVKTKPKMVVMEDLKVSNMMKNKHLSKAIQKQGFNMFIDQMKYKCNKLGIKFVAADTFYPSSKKCSNCGTIKKDLKLSDRVYKCICGFTCDRDKNAAYNLANYGLEISL